MIAWLALTRCAASRVSTCNSPRRTIVYSSNSGVCPGSLQPEGLVIFAMLIADVPEFTRPTSSSIIFGGCPAAGMTVGVEMIRAIPNNYMQNHLGAITFPVRQKKTGQSREI